MTNRDKAIIDDLQRFRAMTREQIARLHFNNIKNSTDQCNKVLLRLKRDGHVAVSKERRMYTYFPAKHIKKDSSKLNHFLAIADFYCELSKHDPVRRFDVEPKLGGKGYPEPDAFMIWRATPFFIEVQRSDYSSKQWQEKMNRYEQYYHSNDWQRLDWQPKDKKVLPVIWIVGKGPGMVQGTSFRVFHATVEEMVQKMNKR